MFFRLFASKKRAEFLQFSDKKIVKITSKTGWKMPLDVAKANAKTAAINDAFAAIGTAALTKMPPSKRNTEPLAWEFLVASHLLRIAEARKKLAHKRAVTGGVLFDHEARPMPFGTNAVVYAGDVVEISVSVTTPASRLDIAAFLEDLVKSGVKRLLVETLTARHTTESRPPHKFGAALVTPREPAK